MSRVIIISDLHLPVAHPGALDFCVDMYNKYQCDTVVQIGDVIDHHAVSRHDKHPDCPSAKDEYVIVAEQLAQWYDTFPEAIVTIGNHDNRPVELACEKAGVPEMYFKELGDIWNTPNWEWVYDIVIDDVYYFHGIGSAGKTPALNKSNTIHMPVVMGHRHSVAGHHWGAGPRERWFGLDVGCLIDVDAFQFAYGKHSNKKPLIGCGFVIDGMPKFEMMPCSQGELYHRSNF